MAVTQPAGTLGSMARYAGLVEEAISSQCGESEGLTVKTIELAWPGDKPRWMSDSVYSWLNHIWLMLTASFRLRQKRSDLVHVLDGSYAYIVPRSKRTPVVTTVHDLIPALQGTGYFGPEIGSFPGRFVVRRALAGLRRSSHLVPVSENTARDLSMEIGNEKVPVSVVQAPLEPVFQIAATGSGSRGVVRESPYVLHVGNNGFYKNRPGVLRIFKHIRGVQELRLIMAGPAPDSTLLALIHELSLEDRVEFIQGIDDDELVKLYSGAALFLFPSLYEGFGWPPLEAMACGCPVVASTEGSLPGVLGEAALMAPAADEEKLASYCESVLNDERLAMGLSDSGRTHASQFTIERMGEQLLAVYRAALGDRASRDQTGDKD
jgi:glycosyltransferase involved in cell wall biosynthesis